MVNTPREMEEPSSNDLTQSREMDNSVTAENKGKEREHRRSHGNIASDAFVPCRIAAPGPGFENMVSPQSRRSNNIPGGIAHNNRFLLRSGMNMTAHVAWNFLERTGFGEKDVSEPFSGVNDERDKPPRNETSALLVEMKGS